MTRPGGRRIAAIWLLAVVTALTSGLLAAQTAAQRPDWNQPFDPFRIVGTIHYVGTSELCAYLITTPQGHILIDGGLPESVALIEASIVKLGFKLEDVKILLTTQAHFDHVGSLAALAAKSHGQVMVMAGDAELVEHGGHGDYLFGDSNPFAPVHVDRVLKDGDTVSLGGTTLVAHLTPGHTRGCTTWTTTVSEGDLKYLVEFVGSTSVNPGTRLVHMPSYPGIRADYERAFRVQRGMHPDIFLGAHAGFFDLAAKRQRQVASPTPNPFVDPKGYAALVAKSEKRFHELVATEMGH